MNEKAEIVKPEFVRVVNLALSGADPGEALFKASAHIPQQRIHLNTADKMVIHTTDATEGVYLQLLGALHRVLHALQHTQPSAPFVFALDLRLGV